MNKNKNNPFRKGIGGGFGGKIDKSKKESEWGKVKFNPVAKTAVTEQATPWSQFKHEIVQKQEDDQRESQGHIKSSNAEKFLKKREENYRRNLIESKQTEPTQWEDFSDDIAPAPKSSKNKKASKEYKNLQSIDKNNFDPKLLTADQNNFLKKVITLHTYKTKGVSIKQSIKQMRFEGVKKHPFKKSK